MGLLMADTPRQPPIGPTYVCKVLDNPFRLVAGTTRDGSMVTFEYFEADNTFPFFLQEATWRKTEPEAVLEFISVHTWVVDMNMWSTRYGFMTLHNDYYGDPDDPYFLTVDDPAYSIDALLASIEVNVDVDKLASCKHFTPVYRLETTPDEPGHIDHPQHDGDCPDKIADDSSQPTPSEQDSRIPPAPPKPDETQDTKIPMEETLDKTAQKRPGRCNEEAGRQFASTSPGVDSSGNWTSEDSTGPTKQSEPVDAQCELTLSSSDTCTSHECSSEDNPSLSNILQTEKPPRPTPAKRVRIRDPRNDLYDFRPGDCDLFDPRFDDPTEEEEYNQFSEDERKLISFQFARRKWEDIKGIYSPRELRRMLPFWRKCTSEDQLRVVHAKAEKKPHWWHR